MLLVRYDTGDLGTPGSLTLLNWRTYATLELPWKDNQNNISCIPPGTYKLRVRPASESRKFNYDHIEVLGVPGRDKILIHVGNYLRNTDGCILPGRYPSNLPNGQYVVYDSSVAFRDILAAVRQGDDKLVIAAPNYTDVNGIPVCNTEALPTPIARH